MNSKAQAKSDTKKPTDRCILEQAEREERGEPPIGAERPATGAINLPALGSPEEYAAFQELQKIRELPITLTLAEACDLVGRDLSPTAFQRDVFDVIARELDTLSNLAEQTSGFDGWCAFQNLCSRVQLAGKIAAVIGGAS